MAESMASMDYRIGSLGRLLCDGREKIQKLEQFVMRNFPRDVASLLSSEPGVIMERRGQGFVVKECEKIDNYQIIRQREVRGINNSTNVRCYKDLPIVDLKSHKTYFLNPVSKIVKRIGRRRICSKQPPVMLLKDQEGRLLKLDEKGIFSLAKEQGQLINTSVHLPRFHQFSEDLKHEDRERLPRMSLLDSLQGAIDVVE